ncbi:hypothetical protein J2S44_002630 [Catenuloplanes niger]|uniref:Uncharacterized protein n=1 Tax=Catenuloplanes niger TaxID=587534 RepID=A0AAE3ZR97_9ACTN|nr:hypothetical protein [Catenuloplanes niger]
MIIAAIVAALAAATAWVRKRRTRRAERESGAGTAP